MPRSIFKDILANKMDLSLWFVTYSGDEIVVVALNKVLNDIVWIDHLGVLPAYRKRGIGKSLMHHSLNIFRQRNYK
ncbi:MAG: GNAT family N-acetyltransferase [Chloroflexota bacterium]